MKKFKFSSAENLRYHQCLYFVLFFAGASGMRLCNRNLFVRLDRNVCKHTGYANCPTPMLHTALCNMHVMAWNRFLLGYQWVSNFRVTRSPVRTPPVIHLGNQGGKDSWQRQGVSFINIRDHLFAQPFCICFKDHYGIHGIISSVSVLTPGSMNSD